MLHIDIPICNQRRDRQTEGHTTGNILIGQILHLIISHLVLRLNVKRQRSGQNGDRTVFLCYRIKGQVCHRDIQGELHISIARNVQFLSLHSVAQLVVLAGLCGLCIVRQRANGIRCSFGVCAVKNILFDSLRLNRPLNVIFANSNRDRIRCCAGFRNRDHAFSRIPVYGCCGNGGCAGLYAGHLAVPVNRGNRFVTGFPRYASVGCICRRNSSGEGFGAAHFHIELCFV